MLFTFPRLRGKAGMGAGIGRQVLMHNPTITSRQVKSITFVILRTMKTAISIPDRVFRSAEQLAARLGVSRSELYSQAVAALIERHRDDIVTAHLNEIYGAGVNDSALDPGLRLVQQRSLAPGKW